MSLNKVLLIGHVGKDPKVRYIDNGVAVAQLDLATTDPGYTLPNGTQVPERTEWHNIVLWRGLAQIVEKYVKKGDKIFIEGQIRTRSYNDKNGKQRYLTEIWAERLELMSKPPISPGIGENAPASPAKEETPRNADRLPF